MMSMTHHIQEGLRILLLLLFLVGLEGHGKYRDRMPNGYSVPDPCNAGETWQGSGHRRPEGGGKENAFGKSFKHVEHHHWTRELCMTDSDQDGKTNGEELGDPDCTWSPGDKPSGPAKSHPGVCEPLDSQKCQEINCPWLSCCENIKASTKPKTNSTLLSVCFRNSDRGQQMTVKFISKENISKLKANSFSNEMTLADDLFHTVGPMSRRFAQDSVQTFRVTEDDPPPTSCVSVAVAEAERYPRQPAALARDLALLLPRHRLPHATHCQSFGSAPVSLCSWFTSRHIGDGLHGGLCDWRLFLDIGLQGIGKMSASPVSCKEVRNQLRNHPCVTDPMAFAVIRAQCRHYQREDLAEVLDECF